MSIESLYTELEEARSGWLQVYDLLRQAQYETTSTRQALDNVTVEILHSRILLVFEIIFGMRPVSDDTATSLVLSARAVEMQSQITNFKNQAQTLLNQFSPHLRDGVVIKDANSNFSCQVFHEGNNTANFDVSSNFSSINTHVNQLLIQVGQILPICKADAIGDLAARSHALAEVVRETESLRNETRKLVKAAEQSATGAAEKGKGTLDIFSQSEAVYSKLQALQQQTEKESASVTALVAQIKTTGANADTLEKQISSYQSKFDAFQSQLDNKLKMFADFETFTKQAEKANQERGEEIDRLTAKADTMIRGATTAGLSKSLEDTRELYGKRMFWARIGFFVSITFLTLSAFPLAAHLLPGLFGDWVPSVSEQAQNSNYGIVGKVFLLLPATWLTIFFTKSYAEFFHLEREYAHKAALAKSIEGFKREAPKYQEEITSSVFGEILNNPSKGKSPEPANHPLYEVLTKRLFQLFGKNAD